MKQEIPSFCALCKSRCGATYIVEDGKLVSARSFPDHPTGKALCMKGKAAPEILYSEDRILYPMRRTNPKTDPDPGWERISWDAALEEIAARLGGIRDEDGAEAVAMGVTTPSGTPFSDAFDWAHRFQYAFGTPNNVSGTEVCNWNKDEAHKLTVGSSILYPDYANADTIVLWGFNPSAVWLDQATQVAEARARGATIISVDPRNAGYARDADHWLRVEPGQDGALLMGLAHLMIAKKGYDESFLTRWSNGPFLVRGDTGQFLRSVDLPDGDGDDYLALDPAGNLVRLPAQLSTASELPENIVLRGDKTVNTRDGEVHCTTAFELYAQRASAYPPSHAEQVTGVPAEQIEATAETLMSAKSVCYYAWTGIAQSGNATQTDRALAMLIAMKGCYDAPGGNVAFAKHPTNPIMPLNMLPEEQRQKALGLSERPLGPPSQGMITSKDFYTSVLEGKPYKIRGMLSFGANHVVSHGETDRGAKAYASLEFFAHCNTVVTPTARYADILLPSNTPWEREGLRVGFDISQSANELVQYRQPVVQSQGESRSDLKIMFDLAVLMGFGNAFFNGDIDAAYAHVLEPSGLSLDELKANPEGVRKPLTYTPRKYAGRTDNGYKGFATDTTRVEIYSELLHRHGYAALPEFVMPPRNRDKYPFTLTTAKTGYYCHSQYRNIPSLRKRVPEPLVSVCAATAEDLGLEEHDMVWIENDLGRIQMKLTVDDSLHPRTVSAAYGWWQGNKTLGLPGYDPLSEYGSNYNRLIAPDAIDPINGAVPHRLSECRLYPIDTNIAQKPAWQGFAPATVTSLEKVTEDVMRVSFSVEGYDLLPDFLPGQHITLKLTMAPDGPEVIRCYSLVGRARDPDRRAYSISVRQVMPPADAPDAPAGAMSSYINQSLSLGDTVWLKAPAGRFVIPIDSEAPIVLVAGGIGITPFLSQLETLAATGGTTRVHLVYANRNNAAHAYRDRISALQARIPTLSVTNIYNAPNDADQVGQHFDKKGFVEVEDILLTEFAEITPEIYMCGPPPMLAALQSALIAHNHPAEKIHQELFTAATVSAEVPDGPFSIQFQKSGITAEWTKDKGTLLQFGESLGVRLESGCRAGQCEACAVEIASGDVQYVTDLIEKPNSRCLLCQAVPKSTLVLDA